jgi:LPXTG-motif cell wall-anchored protein
MKTKTLSGLAAVAIAAAALAGAASPALANGGNTLTGVTATPAVLQSGDVVTVTYTGTPSINWSGAQNFLTTGASGEVLNDFCITGPTNLTTFTAAVSNYQAEAITRTEQFFAGACVDFQTPPVGQVPTYEASYTVLPMVETTDIAAIETVALAPTDSAVLHGEFHADPWVPNGGFFQAVDSINCALAPDLQPVSIPAPLTPIALPSGLTLDSTPTASGVEPMLSVSGTPALGTAGTYKVCVELVESSPVDHAFAYLTIEIAAQPVAELAQTGIDSSTVSAGGLGSLVALVVGAGSMVLTRRRRIATAS